MASPVQRSGWLQLHFLGKMVKDVEGKISHDTHVVREIENIAINSIVLSWIITFLMLDLKQA
jgi:hypothetical protein